MQIVALLVAAFKAIAAIPAILKYAQEFAAAICLWYVEKQTNDTLAKIADAAAMSARAKTDGERYAAAQKWQEALSRPRYS